jgi:branched-chain amino acid transport system ATP-binding protein
MAAPAELVLDGVAAGYGGPPVVQAISLTLREGERIGLLGRNGAGKTTTLAAIMGLAQRLSGRITVNGVAVERLPPHRRCRMGLGYVSQTRDIFPSLTVEENLLSALNGKPKGPALDYAYSLFPRLAERAANGGRQLSGGEQQMLAVARALMGAPRLLLLDEPLEGLAPQIREDLMATIRRLTEESGLGCLLVEQHVDVVLDFASTVIVLENGRIAFAGPVETLRAQPEILARTLGLKKV